MMVSNYDVLLAMTTEDMKNCDANDSVADCGKLSTSAQNAKGLWLENLRDKKLFAVLMMREARAERARKATEFHPLSSMMIRQL